MSTDYYEVLGVSRKATPEEIKKQYKKLAIKYHPDKTSDATHHEKFLIIQAAYEVLKEEESRRRYNKENDIVTGATASSGFPNARSNNGAETSSYSRFYQTRTTYADTPVGSSFFEFYDRSSKMYADHFFRSSRYAATREEENTNMYAEIARKQREEELKRRQEQYMRDTRKQREQEELRQKMEESLRREKEERLRATKATKAAYSTHAQQSAHASRSADTSKTSYVPKPSNYSTSRGFGDAKSEYEKAKEEAYRRARAAEMNRNIPGETPGNDPRNASRNDSLNDPRNRVNQGYHSFKGTDHAEFIILDDEEGDEESEEQSRYYTSDSDDGRDHNHNSGHAKWQSNSHFKDEKWSSHPATHHTDSTARRSSDNFTHKNRDAEGRHNVYRDTTPEEGCVSSSAEISEADGLEEIQQETNSSNAFNDTRSRPPTQYTDNASFASEEAQNGYMSKTSQSAKYRPKVVEVPENIKTDAQEMYSRSSFNGSFGIESAGFPRVRAHSQSSTHPQYSHATSRANTASPFNKSSKKPRLSNFDGMRDSLRVSVEDVDFSDIKSTLPDLTYRARKTSFSAADSAPKRARYAEFTNGASHAETVFTPVNKAFMKTSTGTISVSDLSPKFDDSSLIFTMDSPKLHVREDMTREEWDKYTFQIREYERKFREYRRAVLEYQMGRLEKDERHDSTIYSDTSCLGVYSSCLFNDVLLLQNYTRALQEFRQTLKKFQINCETVNKMTTGTF